jgi:hypothetical protein
MYLYIRYDNDLSIRALYVTVCNTAFYPSVSDPYDAAYYTFNVYGTPQLLKLLVLNLYPVGRSSIHYTAMFCTPPPPKYMRLAMLDFTHKLCIIWCENLAIFWQHLHTIAKQHETIYTKATFWQ